MKNSKPTNVKFCQLKLQLEKLQSVSGLQLEKLQCQLSVSAQPFRSNISPRFRTCIEHICKSSGWKPCSNMSGPYEEYQTRMNPQYQQNTYINFWTSRLQGCWRMAPTVQRLENIHLWNFEAQVNRDCLIWTAKNSTKVKCFQWGSSSKQ